jgi:hypothetical protein
MSLSKNLCMKNIFVKVKLIPHKMSYITSLPNLQPLSCLKLGEHFLLISPTENRDVYSYKAPLSLFPPFFEYN